MSSPDHEVVTAAEVDVCERDEILELARAATALDGVSPLDDQVRLDLLHANTTAKHLTVRRSGQLAGYAHLNHSDPAAPSAHLVVHPGERRGGIGSQLLAAVDGTAAGARAPLRLWAHGDLSAARGFADARGLLRVRELWRMAGPLTAEIAPPTYAEGVSVRTFEPGRDEEAWVAVNAAAFSHHPEQGAMRVADLERRMAEPWFDASGFFVAEQAGAMVGFHWTKVHRSHPGYRGPVGEVYVLGVAPEAQGLGLGTALTATGLRHLRSRGLDSVLLYVEGDNSAAIAVYEKLGLRRRAVDAMYAVPAAAAAPA